MSNCCSGLFTHVSVLLERFTETAADGSYLMEQLWSSGAGMLKKCEEPLLDG